MDLEVSKRYRAQFEHVGVVFAGLHMMHSPVTLVPFTAQDGARHLITYLLSPSCNPSPRFCRVVDKALVIPAAGVATTYIDDSCKQAFNSEAHSGKLEYLQGNLLVEGQYFRNRGPCSGRVTRVSNSGQDQADTKAHSYPKESFHTSRSPWRTRKSFRLGF